MSNHLIPLLATFGFSLLCVAADCLLKRATASDLQAALLPVTAGDAVASILQKHLLIAP